MLLRLMGRQPENLLRRGSCKHHVLDRRVEVADLRHNEVPEIAAGSVEGLEYRHCLRTEEEVCTTF